MKVAGGVRGTQQSSVQLYDKTGTKLLGVNKDMQGTFVIKDAQLWWPYTMSDNYGYMYTLLVGY